MNASRLGLSVAAATLLALGSNAAVAQRNPTPEQRIERLENQLRQVQRQVFPRGQPASTAGFSDEPAATQSSVRTLDERLSGLERQLANVLRQAEENGHRVTVMEAELSRLRSDQDQRLAALERAAEAAASRAAQAPETAIAGTATPGGPAVAATISPAGTTPADPVIAAGAAPADAEDPAELAYDEGYELWRAGKHDQAITSLRAFAAAFPKHRRTSWANNLAGRALLDKGEPRAAAEALLANYRSNPKGERAADSLYYLGQALMQLNQPEQACKAYAELESVYGSAMRAELQRLLPGAKTEARCS